MSPSSYESAARALLHCLVCTTGDQAILTQNLKSVTLPNINFADKYRTRFRVVQWAVVHAAGSTMLHGALVQGHGLGLTMSFTNEDISRCYRHLLATMGFGLLLKAV